MQMTKTSPAEAVKLARAPGPGQKGAGPLVQFAQSRGLGWLLGFLAASFGAAAIGGAATSRSVETWYPTLRKPRWNPPNWLFGPVWTVLYAQMAVSAWLVRGKVRKEPQYAQAGLIANVAWGAQLGFNVLWSMVFFGRHQIGGGVAVIVALWSAIVATVVLTARVSRGAAALLLPYLAWTSFASALNVRIWQLNNDR